MITQRVRRNCALMGLIGGAVGGALYGLAATIDAWAVLVSLMVYVPLGCIVGMFGAGFAIGAYEISAKLKSKPLRIVCVGVGGGIGTCIPVVWTGLQFGGSIQWFEWVVIAIATGAFTFAAWRGFRPIGQTEADRGTGAR